MNILDLLKDLDKNQIEIREINTDIEKKQIELLLKVYDLEYILKAHEILRKHAQIFISQGYNISVKYAISVK